MSDRFKGIDTKELELPETVFIRDIETRVFQSIALQCLAKIPDISLIEGSFIDTLLNRDQIERVKGIHVEQDQKNHSIKLKVEVNVAYGVEIPSIAEKIQAELAQEITRLTGLHVATVHVVFKNLIPKDQHSAQTDSSSFLNKALSLEEAGLVGHYSE